MKTLANPPSFDYGKFSARYGEMGSAWFLRMEAGVPTLHYPDSAPTPPVFEDPDESEDSKLRRAVANSALFDDAKWGAFTAAQRDAFLRECLQRVAKMLLGEKQ